MRCSWILVLGCLVAALIVPWNWPLSILGAKLPQALVTGNTVVVKPAANSAMLEASVNRDIQLCISAGVQLHIKSMISAAQLLPLIT